MVLASVVVVAPAAPAEGMCRGHVGLTFDDGPGGTTADLLDALQRNGLRATMFNQGDHANAHPSLVESQVDAGMWVGNHSYSHPHMTQLTRSEVDAEVSRTQRAITEAGGGTPELFRPPYGETNALLQEVVASHGLTEIRWDVDSRDWDGATVDEIVAATAALSDGEVILMHDWPPNTLQAIPGIAEALRAHDLCPGRISPETGRAVAPDLD
ncbi:polysaccharide deacetylase family protein [Saccharopolyspora rhizosphaerae]|uniref:polysaccharide deacetylase family protein n=1 Tax=Saccharopolyspora rhizosphaerae TaxID=2492662 RepID=UPI002D789B73|nr:polysaccharide deacetylase family protein [Saccharopolyspora rhizosphaerae]